MAANRYATEGGRGCSYDAFATCRVEPYWWLDAPRPATDPGTPPPIRDTVDVAVIGSGFTGLTAALTLARAGRRVLVLEAGPPGYGASTRNGGQIGPGNHKFHVGQLVDMLGRERAQRLYREGEEILGWFVQFVRDEGIDCDLALNGRFRGAVTAKQYDALARELDRARNFAGVEGFSIDRAQVEREIQSDLYAGGVVYTSDGGVHPGRLHQGILGKALEAGVQVRADTPVQGYRAEGRGFQITTPRGRVGCRNLLFATNGYTDQRDKRFGGKILKAVSGIIATEPLSAGLASALLPNNRVYGETRRMVNYFRLSPDSRRVLFGGRMPQGPGDDPRTFEPLRRVMVEVLPALADTRIDYCWSGCVGITRDGLPHIGRHDNVHYAMGYNGSGVTRSCYFGRKIALQLLGDAAGHTEFSGLPFEDHRRAARLPFAMNLYIAGLRLRDYLDRWS